MKFYRNLSLVPFSRLSRRQCSGRPIHIVKSALIQNENVLEKFGKKQFKLLKQFGFNFQESPEDCAPNDDLYDINMETKYHVGHFPNQYPSIAQQNVSNFVNKNLMTTFSYKQWIISPDTKQKIGIPITSTIEHHPFALTYPSNKKHTKKKAVHFWKWIKKEDAHKMGYKFTDSIDDKVPILTRKLDKKTHQTLVIYRDLHHNISNIHKIEQLINKYQPNKIILELCPDGASIGLQSFTKWRYKYLVVPLLKMKQLTMRSKHESNIGARWMRIIRNLCILPPSYACIMAIDIAMKQKIALHCSDLSERHIAPMIAFAEAMDCYQTAFFSMIKFPLKKLMKIMSGSNQKLPINLSRICGVRMQPHLYIVAGYRNDAMSLGINECVDERILFIAGEGHCYDIIDRLCGNTKIVNPFKKVNDERVLLKEMTPDHYEGVSKISAEQLTQKEIEKAREVMGDDILLMLVPNKKYGTVQDIKSQMNVEVKTL